MFAENASELSRSNSESSLESIQFELRVNPKYQEGDAGTSSKADRAIAPSEEDMDNNEVCRDGNDEANTLSSSEMCSRVDESHIPSSSYVTASRHHNTAKPGSEIIQNDFNGEETESEEMKNMKTELARQKETIKQLEDRLSKFICSVRKLLGLTLPTKYYDGTLDNIEDDIEDIISKVDAKKLMISMADNVDDEIEEMIRKIDDSKPHLHGSKNV